MVARMQEHNAQRQAQTSGYTGMRRYVLQNERLHKCAEMLVRVDADANQEKHFTVLSEQGWKAAEKHVLNKMLAAEAEASSPDSRSRAELSRDNYEFRTVRAALWNDRMEYVLDVIPRRREARLFEGQIWVDAEDYSLARVEGRPARNPSFWTRSVHFVQTYQKSGAFWFPVSTDSTTDALFFGTTTVTISYFDYRPKSSQGLPPETAALQEGISQ